MDAQQRYHKVIGRKEKLLKYNSSLFQKTSLSFEGNGREMRSFLAVIIVNKFKMK